MRRLLVRLSVTATIAAFAACSSSSGDGNGGSGSGTDGSAEGASGDGAGGSNDGSGNTDGASEDASLDAPGDVTDGAAPLPFTLTSTAFVNNGFIPPIHTCTNGSNVSPPLSWANAPPGTQSYAVVVRDLHPPLGDANYHWVIYDIAAVNTGLPSGVVAVAQPPIPQGAKQTYWSFSSDYSYLGPCPPTGIHDYQFTVYSFATTLLPIGPSTSPSTVDAVIQANKTGSATLTAKYMQ